MNPTPRAVLIFAAGAPLALMLAVAQPGLWALAIAYGLVVLTAVAIDALLGAPLRGIAIAAQIPASAAIGESVPLAFDFAARQAARRVDLDLLLERRGALEPGKGETVTLPPGAAARATIALRPLRRGQIEVDALWVSWRGPLGLARFVRRLALGKVIDILPNVRGVQSAALQFFAHDAIYGVKAQRQRGEGTQFEALREYTPGADPRHIDWKRSARHRKLLVKEFDTERNHPVVIAFDTGHLMLEPIDGLPRLDHAVNAGLLLSWIGLRAGDLMGIFSFDARVRLYHPPIRGLSGFAQIQRSAATIAYHTEETNFTLALADLERRLKRRSLVILFTEFVDTIAAELLLEALGRLANKHVVVLVTLRDPALRALVDRRPDDFSAVAEAVISGNFQRERQTVLERMERMGLHCLDVAAGELSIALINRYLLIKQRGLI
ncbi:DUF58 domain-containing protein [Methylocapsa sp. S129]|uniref:DUF58 domain-containing protein n=1 Tax=Methylocapsa sp. S129 TaxID=1641869 RepID=UPI001FEDCB5E|nr:DUF58 domain-containing protein [Methylocapsa sp. S129]